MSHIYTGRYLVTNEGPPLEGGGLLDRDGCICAVGPLAELKRFHPEAQVVDFGEALLAPVLVNAHTHLELTDYSKWAEEAQEAETPTDFVDWILRLIRVKQAQKKKHFSDSLANGIAQSVAAGTGAIGDILSHYPSRKAYQNAPLLGTLYLESLGQDPSVIQRVKSGLESVLREGSVGNMTLGISPHSPYSISGSYMASLYKKAHEETLRCTTHLAESPAEVEFIEQSRGLLVSKLYPAIGWESLVPRPAGCSPTEYLKRKGGLFAHNLLVHGVQLSSSDIALLAEQQMTLALCPRSNDRLHVGKAPVARLREAGVRLVLGTDSLASSDSLSVWDEMAFAHRWFAGALDAPTLFRMATVDGAAALGLEDRLGSLTAGKDSSFQVLEINPEVAITELDDYLVAPGRSGDIRQVFHQGRALLSGLGESDKYGIDPASRNE